MTPLRTDLLDINNDLFTDWFWYAIGGALTDAKLLIIFTIAIFLFCGNPLSLKPQSFTTYFTLIYIYFNMIRVHKNFGFQKTTMASQSIYFYVEKFTSDKHRDFRRHCMGSVTTTFGRNLGNLLNHSGHTA